MNNNNMNINFTNPEDDRAVNVSLSLRPPSPPPPQPPAPPSPTPFSQPHPVYSPPMEFLYPNYPLYVTPADLVPRSPLPPPPTHPMMNLNIAVNNEPPPRPLGRGRPSRNPRNNGEAHHNRNIEPPYAWATDRPAYVHDKAHLEKHFIYTVTGTVRCNKCDKEYPVVFNIEEKLREFVSFVQSKKGAMHDRAAQEWMTPPSLVCEHCTGDGVRPVIHEKEENINWLFLFLGQMLGHCKLDQLKYFCGRTQNHRTGAKDRVLYLTYREIFKQLLPHLPQDSW